MAGTACRPPTDSQGPAGRIAVFGSTGGGSTMITIRSLSQPGSTGSAPGGQTHHARDRTASARLKPGKMGQVSEGAPRAHWGRTARAARRPRPASSEARGTVRVQSGQDASIIWQRTGAHRGRTVRTGRRPRPVGGRRTPPQSVHVRCDGVHQGAVPDSKSFVCQPSLAPEWPRPPAKRHERRNFDSIVQL